MGSATDGVPPFHVFIRPWHLTTIASYQGQGFTPWATPHTFPNFPLTNPCYTLISCTIPLAFLTPKSLFINQSSWYQSTSLRPTHWATTSTHSYIDPLSNPVVLPSSPHGWTIREHQSFHLHPSSPRTTALCVHLELYPFSWYPVDLWGCPSVQP